LLSKLKQNFPLHNLTSFFLELLFNVTFSYSSTSSSSVFPTKYYVSLSDFPVLGARRLYRFVISLTFHKPVVLQNLIVDQSGRKFLTFYKNHLFITVFIRQQHLTLSRATYSHETTFSCSFSLSSKQRVGLSKWCFSCMLAH
jgi:hypothetical protein